MAKYIRFSLPDALCEQLQTLAHQDESVDRVAKRIILDFIGGEKEESEIEQKMLEMDQRLTAQIEHLTKELGKMQILSALKTEIETGNLRPSPTRTNK